MKTLSNQILDIQNEAALIIKKALDKSNGEIVLFDPAAAIIRGELVDAEMAAGVQIHKDTEYTENDEVYIYKILADDYSPKLFWINEYGYADDVYAVHLTVDQLAAIADGVNTEPTELDRHNIFDRLFIQEIINNLVKTRSIDWGSAAGGMLRDWSGELREKAGLKGKTKRVLHANR